MNKEQLTEAIKQRETEIANYQINIDNYTAMIGMLPKWTEVLLAYRTADPVGFINDWSFEDIQLLSDLQFKDKLERTLLTERLEQRKATFVLKALQQKLEQA
jgi:hypothetical protein